MAAALAAAMVFSPLMAKERSYSNKYQQWGESHQQCGLFKGLQKKPMTETTLLLQLDKEGRQKFKNLPSQTREEVLQTVNQTGTSDYKKIINEAIESQRLKAGIEQERMLHNGMDRIQR